MPSQRRLLCSLRRSREQRNPSFADPFAAKVVLDTVLFVIDGRRAVWFGCLAVFRLSKLDHHLCTRSCEGRTVQKLPAAGRL